MNIVFAHFGAAIPKHLSINLKRATILFPTHQIFLITDQQLSESLYKKVTIHKYIHNHDWWKLQSQLKHSKDFRENFWFTSTARFLALADFSNYFKEEFLHIESDVIIASDFPFEKFSNSKHDFMFPIISDSNAIASTIYIKNSDAANYLAQFALIQSEKNNLTTDMYILSELSKRSDVNFAPLPTAPTNCYEKWKLRNRFLQISDASILSLGGVFDGFDIGRYLFGDDPRNKRGFSTLRDNDTRTYLDVRNLNLVMRPERDFPFLLNSKLGIYTPVFSLHIHSKRLQLFEVKNSNKLIRKYVANSKKDPKTILVFSILIKSAIKSFKRRLKQFNKKVGRFIKEML
jgi:hypothetical protein